MITYDAERDKLVFIRDEGSTFDENVDGWLVLCWANDRPLRVSGVAFLNIGKRLREMGYQPGSGPVRIADLCSPVSDPFAVTSVMAEYKYKIAHTLLGIAVVTPELVNTILAPR